MMSRLLDQSSVDRLAEVARTRVDGKVDTLRRIIWRNVPPGMKRLEGEDRQAFDEVMRRRAAREQAGTMPGDTATHTVENPYYTEEAPL